MGDFDEPMWDDTARPCLIVDLPTDVSDEAVWQMSQLLHDFVNAFGNHYRTELMRVREAAQREHEEFLSDQQFSEAQLDLPFEDPNDPF